MQTLQHSRKPFQTEFTDEVAREYTSQQTEKRKAALLKGSELDDVHTRVVNMEDTVTRLEEKLGDSHICVEDMFKAIMTSQGCKPLVFPPHSPKVPIPAQMSGPAPNLFEGTRTQSLSRADFVHDVPAFPEDLSASLTGQNAVYLDVEDTVAEKSDVDEFVKGLLKDPDEGGNDKVASATVQPITLGDERDCVDNGVAPEATVDITCKQARLEKGGDDSDSAQVEEVCILCIGH